MAHARRPNRKQPKARRIDPAVLTSGAVTLGIAALAASDANAATFTVTNLNDNGPGSLRDAITSANALAGADVITFQSGLTGTIALTTGQLSITDSVDIQGPGAASLTIDAEASSRVFYVYSNAATIDVTISGLTATNGAAEIGGAIADFGENLTLDHVAITNSTAFGPGGGVILEGSSGTLHVRNTTISGNQSSGQGGGIYIYDVGSPADITDSVITGNHANSSGGGLALYGPNFDVTVTRTTVSGNTSDARGGGIYLYDTDGGKFTIDSSTVSGNTALVGGGVYFYGVDDPIVITNSTIVNNQALYGGGVVFYAANGGATISFSTIAGNTASGDAGGLAVLYASVDVNNTIIADNTSGGADQDTITAPEGSINATYTLIENPGSGNLNQGTGVITGVDPQLGPLANNGGPTMTEMPALTSPVINAGDPAFVPPPAFDQRGTGFPRVSGGRVDMGAVEVNGGTIAFSSATYSVNENAGTLTVTVTRTNPIDPASVTYATSNGSATAGADYTATTGTLNFIAGQASATFNVPILDDAIVEGNETFNLALSNPSAGATLGAQSTAIATIVDVEPGVLQFSSATYSVNENAGTVTITVTRTNGATGAVSVNYATSNGTATAGSDYTATSGTLNFVDSQTSATFNVPITNDAVNDPGETFNVTLSVPTGGATLGAQSSAVVTINEVSSGALQFSSPTYTVAENGGAVTITVTRTGGSANPVTVNYATTSGSATSGADFTPTSGTLSWAAGDTTSKTFNVPIIDDTTVESSENFNVTLSSPTGGATLGAQSSAVVTITDFEPGVVQFPTNSITVDETVGSAVITLTRTGGANGPLTVNYTTANGTATAPADYAASSGTVTFADGQTTATINVPIVNDGLREPDEFFTVTISNPTAGSLGSTTSMAVVIAGVPVYVPTLGLFGKFMMALGTIMVGLWALTRRGGLGALLLAAVLCATAVPSAHAAAPKFGGKGQDKTDISGTTVKSIDTGSGAQGPTTVTLQLANGTTLTVPQSAVKVITHNGKHHIKKPGTVADIKPGAKVDVIVKKNKAGDIVSVRVKLLR